MSDFTPIHDLLEVGESIEFSVENFRDINDVANPDNLDRVTISNTDHDTGKDIGGNVILTGDDTRALKQLLKSATDSNPVEVTIHRLTEEILLVSR